MATEVQHPFPEPFAGDDIVAEYVDRCSNWGRWGDDDQLGALNFVGPEEITAAASLVRQGKVVSMTLPYDGAGCQVGGLRNNPMNVMTATGTDHLAGAQDPLPGPFGAARGFGYADDMLVMHNQSGTQWDALSHIFWHGQMWNGKSAAEVTAKGATFGGIEQWQDKIVMRGVLLDVARHKGVPALDPGYAIGVEDLEATAAAQGVELRRGDALIVRTGFMEARRGNWGDYAGGDAPGLSLHTAPWLHEREVAAIVSDTWGIEVRPNEVELFQPLHIVGLVHMGLAFGEIFDLGPIGNDCAADHIYEFLFVAPPLPLTGAAGSPVTALAIK